MTTLVTVVIGEHFSLFDTGNERGDGETLSPEVMKMNDRVGNRLTGLPFIKNVPKEPGNLTKTARTRLASTLNPPASHPAMTGPALKSQKSKKTTGTQSPSLPFLFLT